MECFAYSFFFQGSADILYHGVNEDVFVQVRYLYDGYVERLEVHELAENKHL